MGAVAHHHHDGPRAAALLGINPSTVYRLIITWREEGTLAPEFD